MAFKLMVGVLFIVVVMAVMAFAGTYINASVTTDIHDTIDDTTDIGHRSNMTMMNMSKTYDSGVNAFMMIGWIMVITLPLAAIAICKKLI